MNITETVKPTAMTREQRAAIDSTGIGASQAAQALGMSDYGSPLELFMRKLGMLPPLEESEPMRWGLRHEAGIIEEFRERTGHTVLGTQRHFRSQAHPFLFATCDAILGGNAPLEIKTTASRKAISAIDAGLIPVDWHVQTQQQMYCAGAEEALIAALLNGNRLEILDVRRDDEFWAAALPKLAEFWEHILSRTPPEPTNETAPALYGKLYPGMDGTIEADETICRLVKAFEDSSRAINDMTRQRDGMKASILHRMETAEFCSLPDGRRLRRTVTQIPARVQEVKAHQRLDLRIVKGTE
jgi:putative phage-type endonuclease